MGENLAVHLPSFMKTAQPQGDDRSQVQCDEHHGRVVARDRARRQGKQP